MKVQKKKKKIEPPAHKIIQLKTFLIQQVQKPFYIGGEKRSKGGFRSIKADLWRKQINLFIYLTSTVLQNLKHLKDMFIKVIDL